MSLEHKGVGMFDSLARGYSAKEGPMKGVIQEGMTRREVETKLGICTDVTTSDEVRFTP